MESRILPRRIDHLPCQVWCLLNSASAYHASLSETELLDEYVRESIMDTKEWASLLNGSLEDVKMNSLPNGHAYLCWMGIFCREHVLVCAYLCLHMHAYMLWLWSAHRIGLWNFGHSVLYLCIMYFSLMLICLCFIILLVIWPCFLIHVYLSVSLCYRSRDYHHLLWFEPQFTTRLSPKLYGNHVNEVVLI